MKPYAFLESDMNLTPDDAVAAIIGVDDEKYLMQWRDSKPDIFFPAHWGCFGGAIENGESEAEALSRELLEELAYELDITKSRYFTRFEFDFGFAGHGIIRRSYYEISVASTLLPKLLLGEGSAMRALPAEDLLMKEHTTPYDAHAIWMHAQKRRLCQPTASNSSPDHR